MVIFREITKLELIQIKLELKTVVATDQILIYKHSVWTTPFKQLILERKLWKIV